MKINTEVVKILWMLRGQFKSYLMAIYNIHLNIQITLGTKLTVNKIDIVQSLKTEEENLDKMIMSCQRDVSHWESERTRVPSLVTIFQIFLCVYFNNKNIYIEKKQFIKIYIIICSVDPSNFWGLIGKQIVNILISYPDILSSSNSQVLHMDLKTFN